MTNNGTMPDIPVETIAETSNYPVWTAEEPDGEITYHLELGPVTAHFFGEEWSEFITLIREAVAQGVGAESADDDEEAEMTEVELDWGTLYFNTEEWTEFVDLVGQV